MDAKTFDLVKEYQTKLLEVHKGMLKYMSEEEAYEMLADVLDIHDRELEVEDFINTNKFIGILTQTNQAYYEIPVGHTLCVLYLYDNHYVLAEDLNGKRYYIPMEILRMFLPVEQQLVQQ